MFGLDLVTLTAAYMLATASGCPPQGNAAVEVRVQQHDRPYNTDYTSQQLTQMFGNDIDSTLFTDGKWMIGGVTVTSRDGLTSQTKAHFSFTPNYKTDTACFSIDKVEYEINYKPAIYIASDYKDMGCRYSATLMHEKRHVQQDIKTLTDYKRTIEKAIEKYLYRKQHPMVTREGVEAMQKRALQELNAALEPTWKDLLELRRKRQAEVDTEANYRRDTALCPGQFPEFNGGQ